MPIYIIYYNNCEMSNNKVRNLVEFAKKKDQNKRELMKKKMLSRKKYIRIYYKCVFVFFIS